MKHASIAPVVALFLATSENNWGYCIVFWRLALFVLLDFTTARLLRKSLNLPMFSDKLAMQKWMSGIETGDLSRFTDSALRNLTHGLITWKAQLSRVPIGQISKFVSVTFKTFLLQSKANSLYTIDTSLWLDVSYRRHFRQLQHKFANRILL